jgi:hypothetical protein
MYFQGSALEEVLAVWFGLLEIEKFSIELTDRTSVVIATSNEIYFFWNLYREFANKNSWYNH